MDFNCCYLLLLLLLLAGYVLSMLYSFEGRPKLAEFDTATCIMSGNNSVVRPDVEIVGHIDVIWLC